MAFPVVPIVVGGLIDLAKGWFDQRKTKQESAQRIEEAKAEATIERLKTAQELDAAWEQTAIEQSGWKDEWFTVLLSIPAIMCFIPGGAEYVMTGFAALEGAPDWYFVSFVVAIAASFGVKPLINHVLDRLKK